MIVRLPWPDMKLMPNKSKGRAWQSASKIRAEQRAAAVLCTQAALQTTGEKSYIGNIPLSLLYLSPDKRHRDLDNLLAASKPIIDGLAQALGVDDSRFKPILVDSVHAGGEGALIAAVGIKIISGVNL
jgi:crossover junction endodeoxyribonuclease RusA